MENNEYDYVAAFWVNNHICKVLTILKQPHKRY